MAQITAPRAPSGMLFSELSDTIQTSACAQSHLWHEHESLRSGSQSHILPPISHLWMLALVYSQVPLLGDSVIPKGRTRRRRNGRGNPSYLEENWLYGRGIASGFETLPVYPQSCVHHAMCCECKIYFLAVYLIYSLLVVNYIHCLQFLFPLNSYLQGKRNMYWFYSVWTLNA